MAEEIIPQQLLEYWVCPKNTGDDQVNPIPIGFISTSFTFDAEFFEEECLTRFLSMETEKENDGAAYLIEREEKLAGLHCGIVFVDQQHCKGARSLRWDLVSCRIKNGILHAKVTILQWSNCIRLIISSANLTKTGYCINQEVFGVFDYYLEAEENPDLIAETLNFLDGIANEQCGDIVKSRYFNFKTEVLAQLKKWKIAERKYKKDEIGVGLVMISPDKKDGLTQLREHWSNTFYSSPFEAYVISPFFDPEYTDTTPSARIFDIMRQKGEVLVHYSVTGEELENDSNSFLVNAPDYLQKVPRSSVHEVAFGAVTELGKNESSKDVPRPLHAKAICICNEDSNVYMIGSSNFTSPALGLGRKRNYEANVVFYASKDRNPKAIRQLENAWIPSKRLEGNLQFRYRVNEDSTEAEPEILYLPLCFQEAFLSNKENRLLLTIKFSTKELPKGFDISFKKTGTPKEKAISILTESNWIAMGQPLEVLIPWTEIEQPNFLLVSWKDSDAKAFWPVVIESQLTLPPVEELRNLPLESLLLILSSNQPLHRLLKLIERGRNTSSRQFEVNMLDALKSVDSSGFLLQRTRRISYAMNALKARIEKPVFTMETLNWRLSGPIGVSALVDAIIKEAASDGERRFLLSELILELSRIEPKPTENSLKSADIKMAVKKVMNEIIANLKHLTLSSEDPIARYSEKAINQVMNEL